MTALAINPQMPDWPLPRPDGRKSSHLKFWFSSRVEATREGRAVSFSQSGNELHLAARIADVLRRRLYPNSALRAKQLAYDLRVSERTIWNLLNGNSPPRGETLWQLCNFFGPSFIGELFGCHVVRLSDRRMLDAIRKIEEGHRELREASK